MRPRSLLLNLALLHTGKNKPRPAESQSAPKGANQRCCLIGIDRQIGYKNHLSQLVRAVKAAQAAQAPWAAPWLPERVDIGGNF